MLRLLRFTLFFRTMQLGNPLLSDVVGRRNLARTEAGALTTNDVINQTGILLLLLSIAATITWNMAAEPAAAMPLTIGGAIVGLLLGLGICFVGAMRNVWCIAPYAIAEGLFLGGLSRIFDQIYPGLAVDAVLATVCCFGGVLALFYFRVIRATPGFVKFILACLVGILILSLVNVVGFFFGFRIGGIQDTSMLSIGISVFIVAIAALSFIIDFHNIEVAVSEGVAKKEGWFLAFGLVVTLVWLYLELLRLLAKLRGRD